MKMNLFDRILLTLSALVWLAASVALIGVGIGYFSFDVLARWFAENASLTFSAAVVVVGLVGVFVSLKLLFSHPTADRTQEITEVLVKDTANGAIRISASALTALARRGAAKVEGIREMRCMITPEHGSVAIMFLVTLMPEVVVPELTEKLQAEVKQYVQEHAGISVQSVRVRVEETLPALR